MYTLIHGIAIGFSIAAPVGPIGMLCIKRTIDHGRLLGLVTGLGAACADGVYGAISASGLFLITQVLLNFGPYLKLGGSGLLLWMGISTIRQRGRSASTHACRDTTGSNSRVTFAARAFASTFLLTLANPMTILSFTAILASSVHHQPESFRLNVPGSSLLVFSCFDHMSPVCDKLFMVIGIFVGSCLWWLLLSSTVAIFRSGPTAGFSRLINIASGVILIVFALVSMCKP